MAATVEELSSLYPGRKLEHQRAGEGICRGDANRLEQLVGNLVSNAIILPASNWFSSFFGRKRFFMACTTIFTIASFLCGIAPTLGFLIFARVLQGAGGGALQPLSQAIIRPPARRIDRNLRGSGALVSHHWSARRVPRDRTSLAPAFSDNPGGGQASP